MPPVGFEPTQLALVALRLRIVQISQAATRSGALAGSLRETKDMQMRNSSPNSVSVHPRLETARAYAHSCPFQALSAFLQNAAAAQRGARTDSPPAVP